MITTILLFHTEHEAAVGLKKLESSGIDAGSLSVLVSNVEHSRLLNAETSIHVDLLSEISSANRRDDDGRGAVDGELFGEGGAVSGLVVPFYAQQPSMQVPGIGILGMTGAFDRHEQGVPSLIAYGLSEENAQRCLQALRAGQCVVCITGHEATNNDGTNETSAELFDNLSSSFSEKSNGWSEVGAAEVLRNTR
jgi:hypothetical protein